MTPAHKKIAAKLKDQKRLEKLLVTLRANKPTWLAGFDEPEETIRETLAFMGVRVEEEIKYQDGDANGKLVR